MDEPPLPGVAVVVVDVSTSRRVAATTSGSDGSFSVAGLAPGGYRVGASVDVDGFTPSHDSDGLADWLVEVTLPEGGATGVGFAGTGAGRVTGTVTGGGADLDEPQRELTCRWAGVDGELGTDDDVDFPVRADALGAFSLDGVPDGDYACAPGAGPDDGAVLDANAVVVGGGTAQVALVVTTVGGTGPGASAPGGLLPATGRSGATAVAALVALISGVALVLIARRRPAA